MGIFIGKQRKIVTLQTNYSKLEEFIYKLSENNLVNLKFIRK